MGGERPAMHQRADRPEREARGDLSIAASGEAEENVASWIVVQSAAEVKRLKQNGVERVLPIACSAFCTQDSGVHVTNQIELITSYDFDNVCQILVSEPQPCPVKEHFEHVHVVLQTDTQPLATLCLLVPYLYDTRNCKRNTLKNWVFINSAGKQSRHRIDQFDKH
jgi:hypothetical protein